MGKKRIVAKKGGGKQVSDSKNIQIISSISKKKIREGRIYISSSYNNTMITLTDSIGNVLYTTSAGALGFSGTRKATPFAAAKASGAVSNIAKSAGILKISVYVKGIGSGRDSALRAIASNELEIISIKDITPIPHNGCRPPKPRRV